MGEVSRGEGEGAGMEGGPREGASEGSERYCFVGSQCNFKGVIENKHEAGSRKQEGGSRKEETGAVKRCKGVILWRVLEHLTLFTPSLDMVLNASDGFNLVPLKLEPLLLTDNVVTCERKPITKPLTYFLLHYCILYAESAATVAKNRTPH